MAPNSNANPPGLETPEGLWVQPIEGRVWGEEGHDAILKWPFSSEELVSAIIAGGPQVRPGGWQHYPKGCYHGKLKGGIEVKEMEGQFLTHTHTFIRTHTKESKCNLYTAGKSWGIRHMLKGTLYLECRPQSSAAWRIWPPLSFGTGHHNLKEIAPRRGRTEGSREVGTGRPELLNASE